MRYQGWIALIAGLLAVPMPAFSAEGWGMPGRYAPAAFDGPTQAGFRHYASEYGANPPDYSGMQAHGYRFRPWQRPAPSYARQRGQSTLSTYWGAGQPGERGANAYYPARGSAPTSSPAMSGRASAGAIPQERRQVNRYRPGSSTSYRFRPLPPAPPGYFTQSVQYRPLQIEIPERYVFRPLKPAARTAPPAPNRVARRYPSMNYPWAGGVNQAYRNDPYRPGFSSRNLPWGNPAAPQAGGWTAYRQPFPSPSAFPPAYAQTGRPFPRFRPWPPARRGYTPGPVVVPRYVQQRPIRPYPLPLPAWGDGRWRPRVPAAWYGFREQTAQRPPLPPARLNSYGTDWYDGRGDVDGAWYRLPLKSEPVVTQTWAPLPETNRESGDY